MNCKVNKNRGVLKSEKQVDIDTNIYTEADAVDVERDIGIVYRIRFKSKQDVKYWNFSVESVRDEKLEDIKRNAK
jgi:ribosomal protein L20A (L18A)